MFNSWLLVIFYITLWIYFKFKQSNSHLQFQMHRTSQKRVEKRQGRLILNIKDS